jgi:uncharacterized protein (UPF0210 family)
MHIRTVTVGAREEDVERAAAAAAAARKRLEGAGYVVQTVRLALTTVGSNRCADFPSIARGAEALGLDHGFDYVSLGRVEPDRLPQIAEALAATQIVSANVKIAGRDGQPEPLAIRAAADAIVAISAASPGGFGNFRFAAAACVAPGSPFFPAAHHDGGGPWLAIGPEGAALAIQAVEDSQRHTGSSATAPARLTALVEEHDARIRGALEGLERQTDVFVAGCDWSLAPQPSPSASIGAAIEALSGVPFGAWGTLAAIRSLTDAIRRAKVDRIGFSGVMLPLLEDSTLAWRNAEGRCTLRDLLAFSAVCGTGLDTIPLPGDSTPEQIARVLDEVAALAGALLKPLTARLMPMPGRAAGQDTGIDFAANPHLAGFLCQTRVMAIDL